MPKYFLPIRKLGIHYIPQTTHLQHGCGIKRTAKSHEQYLHHMLKPRRQKQHGVKMGVGRKKKLTFKTGLGRKKKSVKRVHKPRKYRII